MRAKELIMLLGKVNPDSIVLIDAHGIDRRCGNKPHVRLIDVAVESELHDPDGFNRTEFLHKEDQTREAAEKRWDEHGYPVVQGVLLSTLDKGEPIEH